MSLTISFYNAENLIFSNNQVKRLLPEFNKIFTSWEMSFRSGLAHIRKKNVLDFLQKLEPNHIEILATHFQDKIIIKRTEYNTVKNYYYDLENLEKSLNELEGFQNNFSVSRNENQFYICFWR